MQLFENYVYSQLSVDSEGKLTQAANLDYDSKRIASYLANKQPRLYSCQAFDTKPVGENIKQAVQSMINQDPTQDAFMVYDNSRLDEIMKDWNQTIPWIEMRYAVKCNPLKCLLSDLNKKGAGFDIASQGELERLVQLGVNPEKIIFSNPFKLETALDYAYKNGVRLTVADTYGELEKIRRIAPEMKILWRISVPEVKKGNGCVNFGEKFGDAMSSITEIQQKFQKLFEQGYKISGIHFHAGSGHNGSEGFQEWLQVARQCILIGKQIGHPMEILDIGGGFAANCINESFSTVLQYNEKDVLGCQYVAEPGRHIASRLFQLAVRVIGKRVVGNKMSIYVNDGVYHAFNKVATDHVSLNGQRLFFDENNVQNYNNNSNVISVKDKFLPENVEQEVEATIFGMTCDGLDVIASEVVIPKSIDIGDWLIFGGMGAYTYSMLSYFNSMNSCSKILVVENEISTVPQQMQEIGQSILLDGQVTALDNNGAMADLGLGLPIVQQFENLNLMENLQDNVFQDGTANFGSVLPDIVQVL